jgi:hypothetical protein
LTEQIFRPLFVVTSAPIRRIETPVRSAPEERILCSKEQFP